MDLPQIILTHSERDGVAIVAIWNHLARHIAVKVEEQFGSIPPDTPVSILTTKPEPISDIRPLKIMDIDEPMPPPERIESTNIIIPVLFNYGQTDFAGNTIAMRFVCAYKPGVLCVWNVRRRQIASDYCCLILGAMV